MYLSRLTINSHCIFLQICRNFVYNCTVNSASEKLVSTLKSNGYSLTSARKQIFTALLDKEPQTMSRLVGTINVDRATVYRVITLFEKLGIVERIQIGWKYKLELTDQFAAHHHHITCTNCGSTNDFEETHLIESELQRVGQAAGFEVTGHQLELRGLCKNCL